MITYQAVKHYLARDGRLGFFLPGSVFTTESSAGFRRFSIDNNGAGVLSCWSKTTRISSHLTVSVTTQRS